MSPDLEFVQIFGHDQALRRETKPPVLCRITTTRLATVRCQWCRAFNGDGVTAEMRAHLHVHVHVQSISESQPSQQLSKRHGSLSDGPHLEHEAPYLTTT